MLRGLLAAVIMFADLAAPARANDSVAEIGAGGLVLGRSDVIAMESETLFLSMDAVRVDYVFRNNSDRDVTTLVAFPMPDIRLDPYDGSSIPVENDNFLGFTVEADGVTITPSLQQKAIAAGGIDVTDLVRGAGLRLAPFANTGAYGLDLTALTPARIERLQEAGAIVIWDDGQGGREAHAVWTLRSTYYWPMTFPARQTVRVGHRYTPAIGQSVDVFFLAEGGDSAVFRDHERRYCIDEPFLRAVRRSVDRAKTDDGLYYTQAWLSYVLTTGANWAGPIGTFRLIVDKGAPGNYVSFCGQGITKTGPTRFEMTRKDFWPERDLEILFVVAPQN